MKNATSSLREESTMKPNLDKLSEDQETLVTILLKSYLDENVGNSPNFEFFSIPLDYVLDNLRLLDPVMFARLSSPDRRAKLLSNKQNFQFGNDEFHLTPYAAELLGPINFAAGGDDYFKVEGSDRVEQEETEDPDAPPADIIKEVIEEYKAIQMHGRLPPKVPLSDVCPNIAYLLKTFHGYEKEPELRDVNVDNYFRHCSVAKRTEDSSMGFVAFNTTKSIFQQLAEYFPRKVMVEFDRHRSDVVHLNGHRIRYEGENSLNELTDGVEYDSNRKLLKVTNVDQFLSSPYVDSKYDWLNELYNLAENLGILIKSCGGKLHLQMLKKYTFGAEVVSAALAYAPDICKRLPHVFQLEKGILSLKSHDAYAEYVTNAGYDV